MHPCLLHMADSVFLPHVHVFYRNKNQNFSTKLHHILSSMHGNHNCIFAHAGQSDHFPHGLFCVALYFRTLFDLHRKDIYSHVMEEENVKVFDGLGECLSL